ncbi:hypothetical protein GCM10007981_10060 [Thermocladium modestius]|uniref:Uncharacterized protein n=1 Tax=Thermocladium modestius TaxID=62609 RepID=A0A830GUX6_9CREN|nr:hypothetical protein GCM10007981_10060 [Thermocladium modestius]
MVVVAVSVSVAIAVTVVVTVMVLAAVAVLVAVPVMVIVVVLVVVLVMVLAGALTVIVGYFVVIVVDAKAVGETAAGFSRKPIKKPTTTAIMAITPAPMLDLLLIHGSLGDDQ